MSDGLAAAGVAAGGGGGSHVFVRPPPSHPDWQGSLPSKWMDRNTGATRGLRQVPTCCRNGIDGIARQGIGGFGTDWHGRIRDELSEGRSKAANPMLPGWGSREYQWKPSRKVDCMIPSAVVREQMQDVKWTEMPPYVRRRGNIVLDKCAEGFPPTVHGANLESKVLQKRWQKKHHAARMEDLHARHSVRDLDRWEERVLGTSSSLTNLPGLGASEPLMRNSRRSRSASNLFAAHV
eukprot:gnl/MRDRNA2_/MRDRNA2_88207_c0_seq1.p1 gnl/MRDRNA2_/MRDRNA2_88207_c0~~gnl/MRDRNA2_/MRDRNA2_88207_c0_seq1.p1  ORF type:complete len:236 (+),score=35.48 gnl/MRDRNA2_/MRDRNA2_88207_c0_seq1:111-818(+)